MFIPIVFIYYLPYRPCGKEFNTTALANLHIYNVYVKHYTVKKFNNSKEIRKVDTEWYKKRELISLLPFTAKQKTKIKRMTQKGKKKLDKYKKRKEKKLLPQYIITWIIVYVIIYQYLLSGVQHFLQQKKKIFRAVCLN